MGRKKILTDEQKLDRFFEKRLNYKNENSLNVWLDIDDWVKIASRATDRPITKKLFLQTCRKFGLKPERTYSGRICLRMEMKQYSSLFNMKLYRFYDRLCL
ncbi:MAG: hypothetical protein WBI53_11220 [Paludibacter sp.]